MNKRGIDSAITVLLFPVYALYGVLYLISFPLEAILNVIGIDLGIRNEIQNIFRADNIKKYYVYAMFRLMNVALLFYFIYSVLHTSLFKLSAMHYLKRMLFRRMGITSFREVKAKDMNGLKFEQYCAEILRLNGYKNVRLTKASGDQGVDIVAEFKKEKYAIQCKYYSSPLGNKPVQEVHAGKTYYECDKAIVMTNSKFTKGAIELAQSVGVKLWPSIMITDNSRGLTYFWYLIDIIVMAIGYFYMQENMDTYPGIFFFGISIVYLVCFVFICADFLTIKDISYYKKNLSHLNELQIEEYKRALECFAADTDEYENIITYTEDIDEFINAMKEIEHIFEEIEAHEETGMIPEEVEDAMDRFYQNRHKLEIEFLDRSYDRDEDGRLLITEADYKKIMADSSEPDIIAGFIECCEYEDEISD